MLMVHLRSESVVGSERQQFFMEKKEIDDGDDDDDDDGWRRLWVTARWRLGDYTPEEGHRQ